MGVLLGAGRPVAMHQIIMCYDSDMRTTLDLDEELLRTAKTIAAGRKQTVSAVISQLAWKGLQPEPKRYGRRNGFPVLKPVPGGRVITPEHVAELLDEMGE